MSQQLSRHLYFLAGVAVFLSTGLTEGMKFNGLQAKDDGKRVGDSWLTVKGIFQSSKMPQVRFGKMKLCDKTNKKEAKNSVKSC